MRNSRKKNAFTVHTSSTGNVFVTNPDFKFLDTLRKRDTANKVQEFRVYHEKATDNLSIAMQGLIDDCVFLQKQDDWHTFSNLWEQVKPVLFLVHKLNWNRNQESVKQAKEALAMHVLNYHEETIKPIVDVVRMYTDNHKSLANSIESAVVFDEVDRVAAFL